MSRWDRPRTLVARVLDRLPDADPRPALTGAVVGLGTVLVGIPLRDGLVLGGATFVLVTAAVILTAGAEHDWPEHDPEATDGVRRDVAALTWTFVGRDGRVSEAAVRRLRLVAARRLARHGVHLETGRAGAQLRPDQMDPQQVAAARELLGERAWRTLMPTGGLPSLREITHCVEILEMLGPVPTTERPRP
ncbi:hypothetical protein [Actinotalea sp. K2]|uniref:hypothetical protein n=1 Tax=Actinotalea sp. K2 TaxID=2939438 RepID=UPI0020173660|nr:hypothetical protein [Actinotalea sp. K2]MCL3861650.1 hypothetical protein [Actinotalea sp. K2]